MVSVPFEHARPRRSRVSAVAFLAAGALLGSLVAPIMTAAPASAAAAPPDFLETLAGPSVGAMYPSGEQYDAKNDRLVVADTGRDRVLFYSLTGSKLGEFGSYGTGNGQFASPRDVAVDEAGNIYVADAENNRIQAFTETGSFLWTRGGLNMGIDTLNTPIGVTWDAANDMLLVASTGQDLIKAYDASGTRLWNSPTGASLGFDGPRDAQRGPDGKMYVTAYEEHQVKVYDVTPAGVWTTTPLAVLGSSTTGNGPNQLNYPYNVDWSLDGDTAYVSDTGNGRIARWDVSDLANPVWLEPFGGRCTAHPQPCADPPTDAGKFNHLRRVTVDSAGLVYGADFWGAGIEVFNPDTGASVRSIEGDEPAVPGFSEAYAVDVAPNGQVYVMDRLNHRIQRFSAAGDFVNHAGARGTQAGTFSWPEGLTVGPDNRVWALDTRGGRIEDFPANLATTPAIKSYGSTGGGADQMNYASNADVSADNVVWIADTRNDRLMRFDADTKLFLEPIASGELLDPMGVSVTDDAVYVADTGNDRVVKLSLAGAVLATYSTGLNEPQGLEVAPDGSVWVADTKNNRLVHLSDTLVNLGDGFGGLGTGDHQFFDPHDLAFGNGKMYVADTYNNRVQVYEQPESTEPPPAGVDKWAYSSQISAPGGVASMYPAGIAVADANTWYVADSAGSRLITVNPNTGAINPVGGVALDDPRDVVLDSTTAGRLWVLNTGANRVLKLNTDGTNQGGPIMNLNQPYGLDQDADKVYVANTYGNSVRAYAKTATGTVAWEQTTCNGVAFDRPRDVAVADDGRILVADTDNDRIILLDAATGNCDSWFGTTGTGAAQFKSPRTVTSDGAGGMWVGDAFNYRLQHLTLAGASLGATPTEAYGPGPDQFVSPHCVTTIPGSDDVAVCDTFNNRISVWDGSTPTPTRTTTVGGTRPTEGGFNGPFGLAYGPGGELYVADWFNHRIQKFNAAGEFEWQRGNYGPKDGSLIFPRNIVVGGGQVYVTDSENNRIDVFTPSGGFVRRISDATKALSRPHQIALDGSGGFWIADTNNNRVVHLGDNGQEIRAFDITGTATNSRPQGIAVDADGDILVSNSNNHRVERYSATGALLGTVAGTDGVDTPAGLQVTGAGADALTWVTDMGNDRVLVLDADGDLVQSLGTAGAGNGQLTDPRGLALDPSDGDVAIADFGNNRVSVWKRATNVTCTTRTATHNASLASGPAVLRYTLAKVELCSNGTASSVDNVGSVQATSVAPAAVKKAMAGLGMTFRLATKGAPKASTLSSGARVQVSGSWSACVDLSYRSAALKAGVKSVRATAHGKLKQRLTNWSVKKIAKSKKIPTRVKHKIADRGMAKVLAKSRVKAGRATLQQLAADVVDRAFAQAGRNGLRQLVAGTCLSKVWAPTITVTVKADGNVSDVVSGPARRLHVS